MNARNLVCKWLAVVKDSGVGPWLAGVLKIAVLRKLSIPVKLTGVLKSFLWPVRKTPDIGVRLALRRSSSKQEWLELLS